MTCESIENRESMNNANQRRTLFPCDNPSHPDMESLTARTRSFCGWTVDVLAISSEFAEAGLFYDGVSDHTTCYCCGGSFKDWEYYDIPMEEHAKWFPQCEYVLRERGCGYVASISQRYPNLDRPTLPTHHQAGGQASQRSRRETPNHQFIQVQRFGPRQNIVTQVVERSPGPVTFYSDADFVDGIRRVNISNSRIVVSATNTAPLEDWVVGNNGSTGIFIRRWP